MDTTSLSPILESAREVLAEMPKREGHIRDIASQAVEQNKSLGLSEEDFVKKVGAALSNSVKRKGSPFAKVVGKKSPSGKALSYRLGMYRLKQSRRALPPSPPSVANNLFLGKAGEYAVMSELLLWGFNVSLMTVDQGIDIIASKDNKFFHVQVKTATPRADGKFYFSIKRSSFDANHSGSTYYIFLMREQNKNTFAIFPSSHLEIQAKAGGIKSSDNGISMMITPGKNSYTMNTKSNIDQFINNFGQIS